MDISDMSKTDLVKLNQETSIKDPLCVDNLINIFGVEKRVAERIIKRIEDKGIKKSNLPDEISLQRVRIEYRETSRFSWTKEECIDFFKLSGLDEDHAIALTNIVKNNNRDSNQSKGTFLSNTYGGDIAKRIYYFLKNEDSASESIQPIVPIVSGIMNPKSQPEDIQESELVDMATLETINTDPEVVLGFDGTYGLGYDVEPVYIGGKECGATDDLSKSLGLSDLRGHSAIYHFFGESNGLFVNAPLKESLKNGWNRYSLISPIRDGSAYGRPGFGRFYVLVQQGSQADKFLGQDPQRLFELMKLHSSTRELGVPNRRGLADIVKYLSKKGSKHLSYEQTLRPGGYLDMPDGYNGRGVGDDFINLETVRSYSSKG